MEGTSFKEGDAPRPARCVLWHQPAAETAVGPLEAKLRARGVEVVRVRSASAAMAELCVRARDGHAAERAGEGPGPLSVVIVEPAACPHAGTLARAIGRYAPHAVVWAFECGPNPTLRPATAQDVLGWPGGADEPPPEPRVVVVPTSDRSGPLGTGEPVRVRARPGLKLAGGPADSPALTAKDEEPDESAGKSSPRQLLTQEELTMLLADDLPDPAHPPA